MKIKMNAEYLSIQRNNNVKIIPNQSRKIKHIHIIKKQPFGRRQSSHNNKKINSSTLK